MPPQAARSMPPVVPADLRKSEPPVRPVPGPEARTSRSLVSETAEREHRKTPAKKNAMLTAVLALVVSLTASALICCGQSSEPR